MEQTEKIEHMRRPLHPMKQMLIGPQKNTFLWVAGHRLVRPNERSFEPSTETDGDETLMDNPGDDEGETGVVKSKMQPMKLSDQEIATQEACGSPSISRLVPCLCWCRWAVIRSQTTARGIKRSSCGKHGLWVLH